jgi:hypothetical protein
MTLLTHSGQVSENTEEHEDSKKIKVPDPSIDEEHGKIEPLETQEKESGEDTTMIEGAWADILGSGQLKKKVSIALIDSLCINGPYLLQNVMKTHEVQQLYLDHQKRNTKHQAHNQ